MVQAHDTRSMSSRDGVAVLTMSAGVVALLVLSDPSQGLVYLLAFPIWIVGRDLGLIAGFLAALTAVVFTVLGTPQGVALGPLGYGACAAVFGATAIAAARAVEPRKVVSLALPALPVLPLLRQRPQIGQVSEALSRRELQVLELLATGANNAEIAAQFVISENTVKSHVSRILQKLPASNRTEAALRYIELYGAPRARLTAASAVAATVVGAIHEDALALKLRDGREMELPLPDSVSEHAVAGSDAIVYFDPSERAVGWYLPDEELGVDLRQHRVA
jgi:DNA-binding CsgD family transcriptional regulator